MILKEQAEAYALPSQNLSPRQFLSFIRAAEKLCIDQSLTPIIVYWSNHNAARLLPSGTFYEELKKEVACLAVFSQDVANLPDEWGVLIKSRHLSLVVFGQQSIKNKEIYQCSGALNVESIDQAFIQSFPGWQATDPKESRHLQDIYSKFGQCENVLAIAQQLQAQWLLCKGASSSPPIEAVVSDKVKTKQLHELAAVLEAGAPESQNKVETEPAHQIEQKSSGEKSQSISQDRATRAQMIIGNIIGKLRYSGDLGSILQFATETLTQAAKAERGVIWQIVGDRLAVTHEYTTSGQACFAGNQLSSEESTAIILEFLSRFPDQSGAGVISVIDTVEDVSLHKMAPTLASLIELGEVKSRLVVQLRSRGIFCGFVELQQCSNVRKWSQADASLLQNVGEMLSVVVQQSFDQSKIEANAREIKLINDIASLFREARDKTAQKPLVQSVKLVADHMGFAHAQIYLYNEEEGALIPQIENHTSQQVPLLETENPFVIAFESGRGKVVNMEYSRQGDSIFGHDMALILPLISEGERLGVISLWERQSNKRIFKAQDKELGLTIAGHLANVIRAEQAILQIRADQARAQIINKVSSEIKQPLKEVDQIMETLVICLRYYFELACSVVSLYDCQKEEFGKSKIVFGERVQEILDKQAKKAKKKEEAESEEDEVINPAERLFAAYLTQLKAGESIFLTEDQLSEYFTECDPKILAQCKAATIVPLIHAGNFEAALCMIQSKQGGPLPQKDMLMVADLTDRVAVVISHAELFAQVERRSVTDPMTGLFNRRYSQEQLSKEADRYQRFGHAFSLVVVDLDYLKKINDGLGHNAGDTAIKHIANVLKRNVRDVDTVGRYGGEEFVILLPETDAQLAGMVARRICSAIAEKPVEGVGTITASLGVATCPVDTCDRDKLFELADQALFVAKKNGRNQVRSASQDLIQEGNEIQPAVSPTSPISTPEVVIQVMSNGQNQEPQISSQLLAEQGLLGVLAQITKSIEERSMEDPSRGQRLIEYVNKIAQALRLSEEHIAVVSLAATCSNLGKVDLPPGMGAKSPETLTPEEIELVKRVPLRTAELLAPAKNLQRVGPIIEACKEHWDGSGYPKGLKGAQIPMEARIITLVDAFIDMTSERSSGKKMSEEEAIQTIQVGVGKEYDPRIAKIFLTMLSKKDDTTNGGKNGA